MDGDEIFSYFLGGCLSFNLEHDLADVKGMETCDGWSVGTEDTLSEDLAEAFSHVGCKVLKQFAAFVAQLDVDETTEWGVVEQLTLCHLGVEHLPVVALGDLADDVAFCRTSL